VVIPSILCFTNADTIQRSIKAHFCAGINMGTEVGVGVGVGGGVGLGNVPIPPVLGKHKPHDVPL
jgi:hypothetical protein